MDQGLVHIIREAYGGDPGAGAVPMIHLTYGPTGGHSRQQAGQHENNPGPCASSHLLPRCIPVERIQCKAGGGSPHPKWRAFR